MSVAGELAEARTLAESLMVDTCEIGNPGTGATDPDTGGWTVTGASTVYTGKCRVQVTDSLDPTSPDYGGAEVTLQRATVAVPITATGIEVGHVVTITAATHDPDLVGAEYTVAAIHRKTHATARRLRVEEVTAG